MGSLFPCFPDEIGWECLVRVELNSHHNLRCVCKSWNAALKNPQFYEKRKRLKISEQRICMLQSIDGIRDRVAVYDLEKNSCKCLQPIPAEIEGFPQLYFLKQKLVFIMDVSSCVWLYDFSCCKWRQGAEIPMSLLGTYASGADEHAGLIYIGGGYDWALAYNVEEDKWDVLPSMNTYMEYDKFYGVRCSRTFEIFDSYTRSWTTRENRFNSFRNFESAFERVHYLTNRGLIEYDYSQDKLNIVGTFPMEEFGRCIRFAVVVSNKIFVESYYPSEGFYMVEPPSERGGTCKLIGIDRPSGLQGHTIRGATLDL